MWKRAVIGAIVFFALWGFVQIALLGTIIDPLLGIILIGFLLLVWVTAQLTASLILRLFRR